MPMIAALILGMLTSCAKEWRPGGCDSCLPEILVDSVMQRANSFAARRWPGHATVSKPDRLMVLFEVEVYSQVTDTDLFRPTANRDARAADSTIFATLYNRGEMIYRVTMRFSYTLIDTLKKDETVQAYTYPLNDAMFPYSY